MQIHHVERFPTAFDLLDLRIRKGRFCSRGSHQVKGHNIRRSDCVCTGRFRADIPVTNPSRFVRVRNIVGSVRPSRTGSNHNAVGVHERGVGNATEFQENLAAEELFHPHAQIFTGRFDLVIDGLLSVQFPSQTNRVSDLVD